MNSKFTNPLTGLANLGNMLALATDINMSFQNLAFDLQPLTLHLHLQTLTRHLLRSSSAASISAKRKDQMACLTGSCATSVPG